MSERLYEIVGLISKLEHQLALSAKETPWMFAPLTHEEYCAGHRYQYIRKICWLDYAPYKRFDSDTFTTGREFHCAFCGVWYSALWRQENLGSAKYPSIYDLLGECAYLRDYQQSLLLPCCSNPCKDALYRIIEHYEKGRDKEWKAINKSRKLLKEARAYLKRNHLQDHWNLPRRESAPDLISQTS